VQQRAPHFVSLPVDGCGIVSKAPSKRFSLLQKRRAKVVFFFLHSNPPVSDLSASGSRSRFASSSSIAWDYDPETKIVSIDRYEDMRPPRRNHFEMILPREVRHQMLRSEWDVSQAQIASAIRNNIKVKNQRRATVNNLGKAEKMEEFFESAGSKIKQGIMLKRSTTKQALELDAMFENANRARNQAKVESMTADMEEEDDQSAFPPRQPQRRPSKVTAEEPSDDSAVGLDISGDEEGLAGDDEGPSTLSVTFSSDTKIESPPTKQLSGLNENLENENPAQDDSVSV
jgi:hypothetical protein